MQAAINFVGKCDFWRDGPSWWPGGGKDQRTYPRKSQVGSHEERTPRDSMVGDLTLHMCTANKSPPSNTPSEIPYSLNSYELGRPLNNAQQRYTHAM